MTGLVKAGQFEEAESFIQREIGDSDAIQIRNNLANIDRKTLNDKQRIKSSLKTLIIS